MGGFAVSRHPAYRRQVRALLGRCPLFFALRALVGAKACYLWLLSGITKVFLFCVVVLTQCNLVGGYWPIGVIRLLNSYWWFFCDYICLFPLYLYVQLIQYFLYYQNLIYQPCKVGLFLHLGKHLLI